MIRKLSWVLAPALGVIATLGFAPYNLWPLTVLALAALFALSAGQSPKRAALLGWLFGFAHFASGVYWVYISTHTYGGAPAWLSVLLGLTLFSYLALYPALAMGLAAKLELFRKPVGWIGLPALWVFLELIRGWFYSGFPWLALGYIGLDTWLARLAPLTGVHGLSGIMLLAALAVYRLYAERGRARWIAAAVLLSPLLAFLLPLPQAWTTEDGAPLDTVIVQSDIHQDEKWLPRMRYEALLRHRRMTEQAWPADLVVWPEVALTQPYEQLQDNYLAEIGADAASRSSTVLLGILVLEGERIYNSVVTLGESHSRYDKRHLVPFGEYFPIPPFLRPLMDVLNLPYKDLDFGAAVQSPLTVRGRKVAISICFEDVFGNEVRRDARDAAFLVNVTNDAWFGLSSAPHQHLQFSRMRAIETGRYVVRAANTGISAVIGPDGTVRARSEQFVQQILRAEVRPRSGLTPYMRWGDGPLWWGAGLVVVLLSFRRFYRRKTP